jgi:parvulin-like peptidyl-prolyl isomerase
VKRSFIAASVAALLTTGILAGCSHPFHGGAAAVVGDGRISSSELGTMVNRGLAAVPADSTSKPATIDLERLDLSQLIQLQVLKRMAKDLKVTVTDAQIDAELTVAAGDSTLDDLYAKAASQGVDKKTLRTFAEVVAYEKAILNGLPIAQDKVQAAYDSAKTSTFEEVHVAHILVATKAEADAINAQLQADPTQFAALAAKSSTDTGSKANGGDLGFVTRGGGLDADFAAAAFAGKDGTIIGPVQTQFGFHLIKVIAHRTISLADATPQLKQQLNGDAFVAAFKKAAAGLSISVNPRFGAWVPDGGSDGLGDVEASDAGALSTPVSPSGTASAAPTASASTGK